MQLKVGSDAQDRDDEDFGGTKAVTGLDHRVARLAKARAYPIIRIGSWRNAADLAFAMNMGVYDTFNVESDGRILERILFSNHDYIQRGRFLKKGYEAFKCAAALRDEVAYIHGTELGLTYWNSLVETNYPGDRGATIEWIVQNIATHTVEWRCGINYALKDGGGTSTGLRRPSSAWRAICNTEWCAFCIGADGLRGSGCYIKDDRQGAWSRAIFIQKGNGEDDPQLERGLMRLNVETLDWQLTYLTHPMNEELRGSRWLIDSLIPAHLAVAQGWTDCILGRDPDHT